MPNNSIKSQHNFFTIEKDNLTTSDVTLTLKSVFRRISELFPVFLYPDTLRVILHQDLTIHEINLRQPFLNVLEEAILHYGRQWEGWDKPCGYYKPDEVQVEGYNSFRAFLIEKCMFIIKHAKEYVDMTKTSREQAINASLIDKKCPYTLLILGPPSILNTMVVSIRGDDILMKQHAEQLWRPVSVDEFLNWPYVSVEVKLLDLHFKRVNAHKFQRYIAKANEKIPPPKNDNVPTILGTSNLEQPFTHTFFRFYTIQLFNILQKVSGINGVRVKELQAIYAQFLEDIKEMNIAHGSMCTNTTVRYNIGKQTYVRSKQMSNSKDDGQAGSAEAVNYVEHISPQIDLTLVSCTAEQDMRDTSSVTFKRLNSIAEKAATINHQELNGFRALVNMGCINYTCTFCHGKFAGAKALKEIMVHFEEAHKLGHPVICPKCHKPFQVKTLAAFRWKHTCVPPLKTVYVTT